MREIFVVDGVRTAIAKAGKSSYFANVRADDLLAMTLNEICRRTGIEDKKEMIDDVIVGATYCIADMGWNVARMAVVMAGFPYSVPAYGSDRFCASGLQAIANAYFSINTGWSDLIIAGGVAHMTHVPIGTGNVYNPRIGEFAHENSIKMGWTAENVARKYGVSREEQDALAVRSHQNAHKATVEGLFKKEIMPIEVTVNNKDGSTDTIIADKDQGIRPETTMESLSALPTIFMQDEAATVTAGNSSQTNDAAAAMLIASKEKCTELGLKPKMKLIGFKAVGCDPAEMGIGPAIAIPAVLKQAGMTKDQIGLWEINEAFASQAVYCARELGILDHPFFNPRGNGISLGHPLGCTGVRIATTLMNEMEDYGIKYAVESMCIGNGQGAAAIWEYVG